MNKSNSLDLSFKLAKKGRFYDSLIVLTVFIVYKFSLIEMFCRYQIKKICGIVLRKNKITVAGNKMEIDWQDAGLSKELVAYGGREFFSTKYIKDFMTEDEIMVDIGANIGYYTVTAAKRATGGRVYAIEPVKDNIKILRSNIKLNHCRNCKIYPFAISSKKEMSHIWVHEKKNWSSLEKLLGRIRKQRVNVVTLDQFVESQMGKRPTFVRMDVEGHELEILSGAKKLLSQKRLKIMMEIHPHYLGDRGIDELLKILKKNEFRIDKIFLEINPAIFKFRNLYNRYRKIFSFLPYGEIDKKYYSFPVLAKMLKKKNSDGWRVYFIQVFLKKD